MLHAPDGDLPGIKQAWDSVDSSNEFNGAGIYTVGSGIVVVEGLPESAIELESRASQARNGAVEAEYQLALYYIQLDDGCSREKRADAIETLKKLSKAGHAGALFRLGQVAEFAVNGEGDLGQALALYERSANLGYLYACYYLAVLRLDKDRGCYDPVSGKYWMTIAATHGVSLACETMAESFSESIEKKIYWMEKAAKAGLYSAQVYLAEIYLSRELGRRNPEMAYFWSAVARLSTVQSVNEVPYKLPVEIPLDRRKEACLKAQQWLSKHPRQPLPLLIHKPS